MKHEITSYNTKRMIADSLKKLMAEKPFSKITVSEIIGDCRINRKTFYYHFEDIYALLKWTFEEETVNVLEKIDLYADYEKAIDFVADYIDKNRYIINCAYDSIGRDAMKNFLYADFSGIVKKAIIRASEEKEDNSDEEFKEFAAKFYTEAIAGITIEFAKEKNEEQRRKLLENLKRIIEKQLKG